jgi:hypothetical protein
MTEEVPEWAQQLITKVDDMQVSIDGMQGSLVSLTGVVNRTCDRVTALEAHNRA